MGWTGQVLVDREVGVSSAPVREGYVHVPRHYTEKYVIVRGSTSNRKEVVVDHNDEVVIFYCYSTEEMRHEIR